MGIENQALDGLITSHPELQHGLTPVIPQGERPSHYINVYEAESEVRCAFCDKHTPHKKGFTVRMEDGRIALCGRDCAREFFGDELASNLEEELLKQIRRASKRRIILRTLDGIPEAISVITPDLIRMEERALRAIKFLGEEFNRSGLTKFTDSGHYQLKETRQTWIEREDGIGKTTRVPVYSEHMILEVKAAALLLTRFDTTSRLGMALSALKMLNSADTTKDMSDKVIDRMTALRTDAFRNIESGMNFLDQAAIFFTKENIGSLSKLTEHVKTDLISIALHKRDYGFELVLDSDHWHEKRIRKLSSFTGRPLAADILQPMKGS